MRLAGSYHLQVAATEDDDRSAWDAFLVKVPRAPYQQSSLWAKVKAGQGWRSARMTVTRDGSIHAGAQLLYRAIPLAGAVGFVAVHRGIGHAAKPEVDNAHDMLRPSYAFGFAGTVEFRSWIAIGLSAARSGLPHPCQHGRLRWTKPCQAWQYLYLYLWHWPVLLLAPPLLGHSVALGERLAAATSRRPCRGWRLVGGSATLQPDQDSFGLWLGQTGRVHGCDAGCPRLRRRGSGH